MNENGPSPEEVRRVESTRALNTDFRGMTNMEAIAAKEQIARLKALLKKARQYVMRSEPDFSPTPISDAAELAQCIDTEIRDEA